jgi:hypothetical protein
MTDAAITPGSLHLRRSGPPARSITIEILWLMVFLSWVPIIGATSLDMDVLLNGEGCVLLPEPTARMLAMVSLDAVPVSDLGLLLALGGMIAVAVRARLLALALFVGLGIEGARFVSGCEVVPAADAQLVLRQGAALLSIAGVVLSALIFVTKGHVLSASFMGFVAVVTWEIIGSSVGNLHGLDRVPSILSFVFEGFAPNPAFLFGAMLCLVFLRVLCRIVQDNDMILMQLRVDGRLIQAVVKAFRLWLPMLGIFLVLTLGYDMGWRLLDQRIGAILIKYSDFSHPEEVVGVEAAIDYIDAENIQVWREELENRSLATQNQAEALVRDTAQGTYDFVDDQLPSRAPGTEHNSCKFYDVGCHVMNLAKSIANSIYQTLRRNTLDALEAKLDELERELGQGTEAFRVQAVREIDAVLVGYRERSEVAIGFTFSTWRALGFGLLLYSLLVLIKTYLIVLARVVLHPDWGLVAKLEDGSVPNMHGDARVSKEGELWFGKDRRDILFAARDIQVVNAPTGGRIPMPFTATLSRLMNRTWRMQRIHLGKHTHRVGLTQLPPACLIEWTLRSDECVIFHPAHFVGFSQGTRIKRVTSFNLVNVIFGRVINHCVIGPGVVLLRTRTTAILPRSASGRVSVKAGRSYRPGCFVARDIRAGFSVDCDLDDVMRGNLTLRKSKGDTVLIDTEADHGLRGGFGILRYARTFLVPF